MLVIKLKIVPYIRCVSLEIKSQVYLGLICSLMLCINFFYFVQCCRIRIWFGSVLRAYDPDSGSHLFDMKLIFENF
jgi:hypothetical protein